MGKGASPGCATSASDGSYSLSINYTGDIVVEATGGTYVDEATGAPGVALAAPLTVAGTTGQKLYATPLTAMAFNQAVAGGGLTLATFEAAATQVGTAFGVPSGTSLARTQPVVAGDINAYGNALVAVSGMISSSLSLNTIVNSKPVGVQAGNAPSCTPSVKVAQAEVPAGIYLSDDGAPVAKGLVFDVTEPLPAWRALLPGSGPAMGCEVTDNNSSTISLSCPLVALQSGLRFAQDAVLDALPSSLPAQGVLIAGRHIYARGNLTLSGVPITFPTAGNGAVSPPLTINSGSGGTIATGTDITVVGGTIRSGGGNLITTVPPGTGTLGSGGSLGQAGSISITPSNCGKPG